MKVVLEGEQAEVMALIQAMAGQVVQQAFSPLVDEVTSALAEVGAQVQETPAAFEKLVESWLKGFSLDGTAHWEDKEQTRQTDKGEALRSLGNSRHAKGTLQWIKQQGGLTRAVQSVLGDDPELSRGVAVNMAQVASILFPDFAQTLEHFDPFESLDAFEE